VKLAAILPAAALLFGCSSSAVVQQGPSDTLRAYAEALEQGRVDDAYRLLSGEAKRSMSLEAFRRAVRDNPQDAIEIARSIARPSSDPVVTATVTLPNGDELLLVYEGGRWRIDAAAIDLYGQATPRQALTSFLRAFERRRYDVILRYVPDSEREGPIGALAAAAPAASDGGPAPAAATPAGAPAAGAPVAPWPPGTDNAAALTPEKIRIAFEQDQKDDIQRRVQAIRAALPTSTIEETGDSASMAYGAGGTVALIREHGVWKIRNF
jgi:hypothetical protein